MLGVSAFMNLALHSHPSCLETHCSTLLPASDVLIATASRTHYSLACVSVIAMLMSASHSGEPTGLLTQEAPVMIAEIKMMMTIVISIIIIIIIIIIVLNLLSSS